MSNDNIGTHRLDYQTNAGTTRRHNRRLVLWALMIVVVGLAALMVPPVRWYMGFRGRVRQAELHVPRVQAVVVGDARFSNVQFHGSTTRNGSLLVFGCVGSAADLAALRQIVMSTAPPVPVDWVVEVIAPKTQPSSP